MNLQYVKVAFKKRDHKAYLQWAVDAFKISAASANRKPNSHMCYSEFNEIIDSVATLDADVNHWDISLEHGITQSVWRV